ncbi:TetR/AcrR family transcriptional regulator [Sinorhizobium sp. Sb3]|uniref:TetR/AcrR family transcriptional regulator n=1 Tax=Sinorhizobium/Ensifer group TaxID=227292 RepID=UPI00071D2B07|nr:TetR/AcrR family transcriptional regulator [Sinorhizobium sp. Sb3]KSV83413.1 hypothetical protein N183_38210 [Sinorhizobium sp. Sb3]
MATQQTNKRQLILDTALDIIEAEGIRALTQPKIAKISGLRQSHLTYYFPRKADLYIALLDASHERAERKGSGRNVPLEEMLAALFFEQERMRFFLSILLELGDDPELRSVLSTHAIGLCREISARLGRPPDDPGVLSFVDELRGLGLRALISPPLAEERYRLLQTTAQRHGFSLPGARAE